MLKPQLVFASWGFIVGQAPALHWITSLFADAEGKSFFRPESEKSRVKCKKGYKKIK